MEILIITAHMVQQRYILIVTVMLLDLVMTTALTQWIGEKGRLLLKLEPEL